MDKIGVIYCPVRRLFRNPRKRWAAIEAALKKYGVEYDLVTSEERQSVSRLFHMLLRNGYETIVIAGGDAALNDAVNCLMNVEKHVRDRVALGVIPNGVMNDFAAYWGLGYDDVEKSVRSIKQRRLRRIDVGRLGYKAKDGETMSRYFLNCVNVGLLASIQKLRQDTRRMLWSRRVSFAVSLMFTLFQRMTYKMKYSLNETSEVHHVTTLCVGSAHGYGQTPNATPYNGLLDVTVVRSTLLMQHIEAIVLFLRGKLLNHKRVLPYRTRNMTLISDRRMPVSVDGHALEVQPKTMTVMIEPEEIKFIMEEDDKGKKIS